MKDLIFCSIKVLCPKCDFQFLDVSLESLQAKEEISCPKCNHTFTPNVNVDQLLKLIRVAEKDDFSQEH